MHELIAEIRDLLADVTVIAGKGLPSDGPRRFADRFPRPETELVKARIRLQERADEAYDAQMDAIVSRAKDRWRAQQAALPENSPGLRTDQ